ASRIQDRPVQRLLHVLHRSRGTVALRGAMDEHGLRRDRLYLRRESVLFGRQEPLSGRGCRGPVHHQAQGRHRPGPRIRAGQGRELRHLLEDGVCLLMKWAAIPLVCALAASADAAEIRACGARATSTILGEIGPEFERATGHRIAVSIDVAAAMVRRFDAGEPCDLLVVIENQLDGLIAKGKILAASRTVLARSGIGVEVRKGARKPDISSVDAFRRAVLEAKSIAYLKEGASGVYLAGLFDQMGIAKAIEPKLTRPDTDIVSKLVAEGKVELGIVVITQI